MEFHLDPIYISRRKKCFFFSSQCSIKYFYEQFSFSKYKPQNVTKSFQHQDSLLFSFRVVIYLVEAEMVLDRVERTMPANLVANIVSFFRYYALQFCQNSFIRTVCVEFHNINVEYTIRLRLFNHLQELNVHGFSLIHFRNVSYEKFVVNCLQLWTIASLTFYVEIMVYYAIFKWMRSIQFHRIRAVDFSSSHFFFVF